jgi:hypothetical protein
MTYVAICPCGKGLAVTLFNRCVFLGVLAILALGNVHTIFGILKVLAFGVFALLVIAWRNMVVVASSKQQHIIFDCCMGVALILPLHLSGIVITPCNMTRNDCCIINIVVALS